MEINFDSLECERPDGKILRQEESQSTLKMLLAQARDLQPLYLEWEGGTVIAKRSDKIVKQITSFKEVRIKKSFKERGHHTGDLPWEVDLRNDFDLPDNIWQVYFQKDRFKLYSKFLGISPLRFMKIYQACMYKAFIPEDLREIANRYCRVSGKKRRFNTEYVQALYDRQDVIRQCLKDGQENIVPYIISSKDKVTPSEFRKIVGKSIWKTLLKFSKTRNYLITEFMRKRYADSLNQALCIPSSVLRQPSGRVNYDEYVVSVLRKERLLTKYKEHPTIGHIINDTKRMYTQLGLDLPKQALNWSLAKWEEKHKGCINKINLQEYSPEPFEWLCDVAKDYTSKCGNYKATLLDNAYDIRNEGDLMHHCVGSYADRVKSGNYLVWRISDIHGGNKSTLGCRVADNKASFNQHYGYCNSGIKDEGSVKFRDELIKNINKQFKGLNNEKVN